MIQGAVVAMLAIETISDLRTKTISVIRVSAFLVLGIVLNIVQYYQSVWSIVGGAIIGLILLGYGFASKGGIGYGDGIIFIVCGVYLGLSENVRLLFFSLIAAAVAGGIYALTKRKSIRAEIPFMPCVLGTYLIMLIIQFVEERVCV